MRRCGFAKFPKERLWCGTDSLLGKIVHPELIGLKQPERCGTRAPDSWAEVFEVTVADDGAVDWSEGIEATHFDGCQCRTSWPRPPISQHLVLDFAATSRVADSASNTVHVFRAGVTHRLQRGRLP
jgi:hypothetical protein